LSRVVCSELIAILELLVADVVVSGRRRPRIEVHPPPLVKMLYSNTLHLAAYFFSPPHMGRGRGVAVYWPD
jgi:hypothetical protein